jgi:hypothetical protein
MVETFGGNNNYWRCLHKSQFNSLQHYCLNYTPIDFYEQACHIRGPQTSFAASPRASNGLFGNFEKYIGA